MKISEIKIKADEELNHLAVELRGKLDHARFKAAQKQLKNIREVRVIKRDLARVLTILKIRKTNNSK